MLIALGETQGCIVFKNPTLKGLNVMNVPDFDDQLVLFSLITINNDPLSKFLRKIFLQIA